MSGLVIVFLPNFVYAHKSGGKFRPRCSTGNQRRKVMRMKKISVCSQVICENKNSLFNYFGWPSVDRLPDGTLAMVCSGFRTGHVDPFGKAVICYSKDEGQTWSRPMPFVDTLEDDRDCGILVHHGKVFINTFNNGIRHSAMYEESRRPLAATYYQVVDSLADEADDKYYGSLYVTSDDGYRFSEIKRLPVQTPHGPCLLPDGRLLVVGNPMGKERKDLNILECYAIDEKENLEYLSSIASPAGYAYCEPHAIAVDDRIILQIREDRHDFTILQCESTDGGRTWTEPHPVGIENGSPPHLLRHSNGTLISVYGRRKAPFGQRVMFSRDNGATWDVDYILRDDGPSSDLGYPATVELKDGSLLTVYYQQETVSGPCVIMQSVWRLPEEYR